MTYPKLDGEHAIAFIVFVWPVLFLFVMVVVYFVFLHG